MSREERTRDHLLCKFIRDKFGKNLKGSHTTRLSCNNCNKERGRISSVFKLLYALQNNDWGDWNHIATIDTFVRAKKKIERIGLIHRFRQKIEKEVEGRLRELCLMEIDSILHKHIAVASQAIYVPPRPIENNHHENLPIVRCCPL